MDKGSAAGVTMHNRVPERDRRPVTPELVNEIADKVYATLLRELHIEQERLGCSARGPARTKGGRSG